MKKCNICNKEKIFRLFYKRENSKDKYRNDCIQCHKNNTIKNRLKYEKENINRKNITKTKYCPRCRKLKEGEKFSLCMSRKDGLHDYCKKCDNKGIKIRANKPKSKFKIYKYQAKRRKLAFNLSYKIFYFLINSPCKYCGAKVNPLYPHGIDRVNNNIGYTAKNCVSCCALCNNMKKTSTLKMFLKQIKNIYLYNIK